jgi:hypothetical protein
VVWRSLVVATSLALVAATAAAQLASFGDIVQPTLPANEQLVTQIGAAMPAGDLGTLVSAADVSLTTGGTLQQQLESALAAAPDDAARSRIQGVLNHTQAALQSLRQVRDETSLDAARGRLDQARGEAVEGLSELRPFVLSMTTAAAAAPATVAAAAPAAVTAAAPVALPAAGYVSVLDLATLPVLGLSFMLLGLLLRRAAPPAR